jgi:hypothetical protein
MVGKNIPETQGAFIGGAEAALNRGQDALGYGFHVIPS